MDLLSIKEQIQIQQPYCQKQCKPEDNGQTSSKQLSKKTYQPRTFLVKISFNNEEKRISQIKNLHILSLSKQKYMKY